MNTSINIYSFSYLLCECIYNTQIDSKTNHGVELNFKRTYLNSGLFNYLLPLAVLEVLVGMAYCLMTTFCI